MASSSTISRRLQDWLIGAFGLSTVAAGMAALDDTTRGYFFNALHGELPSLPPWLSYHLVARQVADVLPVGNTSFVAFGLVAVVLVVVTFRI